MSALAALGRQSRMMPPPAAVQEFAESPDWKETSFSSSNDFRASCMLTLEWEEQSHVFRGGPMDPHREREAQGLPSQLITNFCRSVRHKFLLSHQKKVLPKKSPKNTLIISSLIGGISIWMKQCITWVAFSPRSNISCWWINGNFFSNSNNSTIDSQCCY